VQYGEGDANDTAGAASESGPRNVLTSEEVLLLLLLSNVVLSVLSVLLLLSTESSKTLSLLSSVILAHASVCKKQHACGFHYCFHHAPAALMQWLSCVH
jgi:hypothetical protein